MRTYVRLLRGIVSVSPRCITVAQYINTTVLQKVFLATLNQQRKVQSARARRPRRKDVTKDELLQFKQQYEEKNGHERGWKFAACEHFKIDGKTLNKRIAD